MENRREFLNQVLGAIGGAATASVVNPALLRAGEPTPDYVMIIDLNKCTAANPASLPPRPTNRTAPDFFLPG